MISLLSRLLIKNRDAVHDPAVRRAYGTLCGCVGIALNVILFALKYFAGTVSGSIAIVADSFNNLSDAGSSVITLLGFRLASKKPDPDHPYGHGRIEYISGLIVSALILLMGFELGKSSVEKILAPEAVQTGWLPALILLFSIAVKAYMFFYNRAVGKRLGSAAMVATATDSLSDTIATAVVLLSMLISSLTRWNIDAYAGVLVAAFILYAGCNAAKDTLAPLLGQPPAPEFVDGIEALVLAHPEISGIHDLIVHDYGPGRQMITLHAEVDGRGDVFRLHDIIDNIEVELGETFGCHATIHLDPVETDNETVAALRQEIAALAATIDGSITIHDFRMVPGDSHTNVIFDAVVPFAFRMSDAETAAALRRLISEHYPAHNAIVTIDHDYVQRDG